MEQDEACPGVQPLTIPDDDFTGFSSDQLLSREQRIARWQSHRPPISHLKDGVVTSDGEPLPLFDVGDRIVVDVRTALLQNDPWLETIVGRVKSINDMTGLVVVNDETSDQRCPRYRYTSYRDALQTFKLAPPKGDPFTPSRSFLRAARAQEQGLKRQGRPKGSLNRPKQGK